MSDDGRATELYPPIFGIDLRAPAPRRVPLTVMLHGACMDPVSTCEFWSSGGREKSFLACPEGNVACGAAFDWAGPTEDRIAAVDASLAAIDRTYASLLDHEGDVLIGFSRGAFLARELVYARPGRFRGVIFIGAAFVPDPSRFLASGVRRVVFASGDLDGARPTMRRAAAILEARGLTTRFVSLGRIYHALPANLADIMRDQIRWIREEDEGS